ncbi:MAG: S10 family peptidase [bacterium]|nr:S10 family peptidase [bacterium]
MSRLSRYSITLVLLIIGLVPLPAGAQSANAVLQNEAGHMTIEPVNFYFHFGSFFTRLPLRSSEARLWYSFHATDENPQDKPLFVFFNGGPGSSTSAGLLSMYTSRHTLDNTVDTGGGDEFLPNPYSWTQMGNLLYIDARQAGFSYNNMPGVGDYGARFREFNAQNFNSFFDAADFIRLLLRFLDAHPEIQKNRVIIVGESYGGIRAVALLHLLLNYRDYGSGVETYQDEALVDEIQTHYDTVFPEFAGLEVPPETITQQFGHQILIQPALSFLYQQAETYYLLLQPGGVIEQLEAETGITYDPALHWSPMTYIRFVVQRDVYSFNKPGGWLMEFFLNAARLLNFTDNLSLVTGVDVTEIDSLYASQRANAYRLYDAESDMQFLEAEDLVDDLLFKAMSRLEATRFVVEPGDLESVFGSLQPWDRYFTTNNYAANDAFHFWNVALRRGFDIHYREPRFGSMMLKNVAHVHTFITNAAYDVAVYAPAIPPAFARHTDIVSSVSHEEALPVDEDRPGQIVLNYSPQAFLDLADLGTRTIRFPFYGQSCHAVSLTQPEEFFADVGKWLSQNGVSTGTED